jgi:hypothetical protein
MGAALQSAAILAGMFAAAGPMPQAKTLVVAKSGGQYATVQAGLDAARAGDTVLVKAGVYNEAVAFANSGSAAGYLTLQGETGSILDGTGLNADEMIALVSKSYVRVAGFEVRNLRKSGTPIGISVSGAGDHIEIRHNHVHNIENAAGNAHGIAVYGTAGTPISHLLLDGNEIDACKLGQSESMVLNGNVADFIVSNNVVHDNDNIGIDFIGFEGNGPAGQDQARNGLCSGNHVYGISSAANPTYGGERSADGIYVDGGRDIVIERNIVADCDIAFEVASEHQGKTTGNITVRDNFASRSYQGDIMCGGYAADKGNAENIIIAGNTTYGADGGEIILQHNCKRVTLLNNILFASSGRGYLVNSGSNNTEITVDYNLYFGSSTTSPGAWGDSHASFKNPKLKNVPYDLRLTAGSPALQAAPALDTALAGPFDIDGDIRSVGALVDLGADEFSGVNALRSPAAVAWPRPGKRDSRNALGRIVRSRRTGPAFPAKTMPGR